jgi:hypothetical protein
MNEEADHTSATLVEIQREKEVSTDLLLLTPAVSLDIPPYSV